MTEPQDPYTVLIVDDDVAFVWWLGEMFTEAGYQVIPALNGNQALSLVGNLQVEINVLIVNTALSGVGQLVKSLAESAGDLKIVLIHDNRNSKTPNFRYDASLTRPVGREPVSREDWLRKLRTLLKQLEATPHR